MVPSTGMVTGSALFTTMVSVCLSFPDMKGVSDEVTKRAGLDVCLGSEWRWVGGVFWGETYRYPFTQCGILDVFIEGDVNGQIEANFSHAVFSWQEEE